MDKGKFALVTGVTSLATAVPVFAADGVVDATLVQPIVTAITGNVEALLPVGISIMAIFVGVRLIPRMIHMFM